jgi:hypothetical protein
MKMWIQINGRDEDVEFPDGVSYEVLAGGVLKISSGNDIRLYSPAHWQEVMIDTRAAVQRDKQAMPLDDDIKWQ